MRWRPLTYLHCMYQEAALTRVANHGQFVRIEFQQNLRFDRDDFARNLIGSANVFGNQLRSQGVSVADAKILRGTHQPEEVDVHLNSITFVCLRIVSHSEFNIAVDVLEKMYVVSLYTCINQNVRPGQLSADDAIKRRGFERLKWTMHPHRHPGPTSARTSGRSAGKSPTK